MERTALGARVTVLAMHAQYGVSTASPDQQAAAGAPAGGATDQVILVHVDGRVLLANEVRPAGLHRSRAGGGGIRLRPA